VAENQEDFMKKHHNQHNSTKRPRWQNLYRPATNRPATNRPTKLAQHFKDVSDSDEYTLDFRKIKDKEEQIQMSMEDLEWEEYNESYKLEELEYALGSCDGYTARC
jgi:hypothetical protein